MRLPSLQRLHTRMQAVGIDRVAFTIPHNHLQFAGVFLPDVTDYELAFGPVGHTLMLTFEVSSSYEIKAHLGDAYAPLLALLNTGANSGNALQSSAFLRQIDSGFGKLQVTANNVPSYADVIRCYPDIEDAHKVHFIKYLPHKKRGGKHVTPQNLAKTRRLLGQVAHDFCKRNDVSSCWSHIAPIVLIVPILPSGPGYI